MVDHSTFSLITLAYFPVATVAEAMDWAGNSYLRTRVLWVGGYTKAFCSAVGSAQQYQGSLM